MASIKMLHVFQSAPVKGILYSTLRYVALPYKQHLQNAYIAVNHVDLPDWHSSTWPLCTCRFDLSLSSVVSTTHREVSQLWRCYSAQAY